MSLGILNKGGLKKCFQINLPATLDSVKFKWWFKGPAKLPHSVKVVDMKKVYLDRKGGQHFEHLSKWINTGLPPSLSVLILPNHFNSPIVNLPSSLKEIQFGCEFDQLEKLPSALQVITFDAPHDSFSKFNRHFNKLPATLHTIKFTLSSLFDQPRFSSYKFEGVAVYWCQ
jgi:FNIP Repeat